MKTTAHESFHSNPIMSLMKNSSRTWIKTVSVLGLCLFPALIAAEDNPTPPNILVAIAEDCSWLHFSAYGNQLVNTPAFDRVAREGVLFTHAFCSEPTCSPSRAAILTGQHFWRLENASVFGGTLKSKFPVYPVLLERAGYHTGTNGKAWGPGSWIDGGWKENPGGKRYSNFQTFLKSVPSGKPFCYWQGTPDAHRPYKRDLTLKAGKDPANVKLPPFLPDRLEVRMDVLDYYAEIERFDRLVGQLLDLLDESGQKDNTIVVVTSDHGMPFARGKANLYDLGVRVPLAIRWPARVKEARTVDDFVSLTDLAPTFLEAVGVSADPSMTGQSLLDLLFSSQEGRIDPHRSRVVFGKEMGVGAFYGTNRLHGYPNRAIRTDRFLYIRNYDVDRMPGYNAVQGGPATEIMKSERNEDPAIARCYELSYGNRPLEELYDSVKDPFQMKNLAQLPKYTEKKKQLSAELDRYLAKTKDPRTLGMSSMFLDYPIWYRRGPKAGQSVFLERDRNGQLGLKTVLEKTPTQ